MDQNGAASEIRIHTSMTLPPQSSASTSSAIAADKNIIPYDFMLIN